MIGAVLLSFRLCVAEQRPLILIFSPAAPAYGHELQRILEEDGRFDAEVTVLTSSEAFNLMMHYPTVKVGIVALGGDANRNISSTLRWFFRQGGGLVGLGFAGSEASVDIASKEVFPIFGNSYKMGAFDMTTRSYATRQIRDEEDDISRGLADFTLSDQKLVLSVDPATKAYVARAPEEGEYKVLYRESTTGAPSVVKYQNGGYSVTFASFAGTDDPGSSYFGHFAGSDEFRALFTNAVDWVWNAESKYSRSMAEALTYEDRMEQKRLIRQQADERDRNAERVWMMRAIVVAVLCVGAIGCVYRLFFTVPPAGRSSRATHDIG